MRRLVLPALLGALLASSPALAQAPAGEAPEPPAVLAPVVVTAPPPVAASSEVLIRGRDFELLPQGRPADIVRLIPGFIISQHQGGGKAEQYLLRGFDADHGTYYDLSIFNDFTLFLNDPQNGDAINQRDRRFLAGIDAQYQRRSRPFGVNVTTTGGFQYRIDTPHVVLTKQRDDRVSRPEA